MDGFDGMICASLHRTNASLSYEKIQVFWGCPEPPVAMATLTSTVVLSF
jgi:hypothetical protein